MQMIVNSHYSPAPPLTSENIPATDKNADIVFIGGGPIGLWTAIQTAALSGKKIVVLEKYEEYQRKDINLRLNKSSFNGSAEDPGLQALVANWKQRKIVPIKEMEEGLAKRAQELGITFIRGFEAKPSDLPEQFPSAKLFIGADGRWSNVRKQIFDDNYSFNKTLQYTVQVQYIMHKKKDIPAKSFKKVADLVESYSTQAIAGYYIHQTTVPQEDGSFKVSLQIFVGREIYDKMKDANAKNPYYFENDLDKLPKHLARALKKWWGAREYFHGETIEPAAGKLNKIKVVPLDSYAAQNTVIEKDGKVWALVGDSAAGFPFFRSINNGLIAGTDLAKNTAKAFTEQDQKQAESLPTSSLKWYAFKAKIRAYVEFAVAFFKNLYISIHCLIFDNRVKRSKASLYPYDEIKRLGNMTWKKLTLTQ